LNHNQNRTAAVVGDFDKKEWIRELK